jgi:hypothetical protein
LPSLHEFFNKGRGKHIITINRGKYQAENEKVAGRNREGVKLEREKRRTFYPSNL